MATTNPFDLLGADDAEDPSLLLAAQQPKAETKKAAAPSTKAAAGVAKPAQGKFPSKPTPPAQAVREGKTDSAQGGGRGGGRGYGGGYGGGYSRDRGAGGGSNRESSFNDNSYGNRDFSAPQGTYEADSGKPFERRGGGGYGVRDSGPRGGRRGGYNNGGDFREGDRERPRRQFDRHSGSVQGNEMKREGSGQGNWGTETEDLTQVAEGEEVEIVEKVEKIEKPEKVLSPEDIAAAEAEKEAARKRAEEKAIEDKQMTLEEYEKVLEEKRKALQADKTEGRKVDAKEFESMQALSSKKENHDIFIKLGSEKDKKVVEKEEKAKKSVSINEFLKPAEGERYNNRGGRGRGGVSGGGNETRNARELKIEDPGQFPSLGGK